MSFSSVPLETASAGVAPLIGGGAALLGVLALTPLVIRLARRRGWVDRPSEDRWSDRPVALLGGVAIAAAVLVGSTVGGAPLVAAWPVWAGAGLVFAVGLADDLWRVPPEGKVLAQGLATLLLLYAGSAFWKDGPGWVSLPLTFLWVIGVTNAFNLIDSIDGLAAGVAAIAGGALVLIGVTLDQGGGTVVAAALAGGALGFLAYNAPPARVFMGDCGSLFLGYLLAALALGVQGSGQPVLGPLLPVAVLVVPIVDTTFVTVTRLLQGRRVTDGGTDHVHHRLVRLGLSERAAVGVLWGVGTVFGGVAWVALWAGPTVALAGAGGGLAVVGVAGRALANPEAASSHGRSGERRRSSS